MGAIQNSMLHLISSAGVAAHAIGSQSNNKSTISEANDASKNELMAQKAKINAEQLKKLKLQNKNLRLQNRALKAKQIVNKEEKPNE